MEYFFRLVDDAGKELYPGCSKFSKLHFMVRLLHIKFLGGWSNKSFDMLLKLLKDILPDGSTLSKNFNAARNTVKCLGLGYTNIHACENDCILFWKDNQHLNACPTCKTSRWKSEKTSPNGKRVHRVPKKVLRYFPIKKRLQRYFMSSKTAAKTRWDDEGRTKDGLLRHLADAPFWKDFDSKYPEFASDSRNLRLAVAADGFNPHRTLNSNYSIWPIILIPYNLPPWKCMKQTNFILSLLIPGRKSAAGDMDVYIEPLIDDMIDMFVDGIRTYDASKGECFQLRAAILCTISDLPGLGHLLACSTSGKVACPECHSHICSIQLKKGGKYVYMCHRRFLDADHIFRFNANSFDGTIEQRPAPAPLSGEEILNLRAKIQWTFGKDPITKKPAKQPHKDKAPRTVWKRQSIWFRLPYWKDLLLQHNFDVMHIEKNICDFIINILLDIDGKSKDNLNARLDMQNFGIKNSLHPIEVEDSFYLPAALYTMSPDEKKLFCQILKGVKFPDGYASDLNRNVHVEDKKIIGLKSHDNHILLQDLLGPAVRHILPTQTSAALIRLYWDIDRSLFTWFMTSAATKWKEFKSELKKAFMKLYRDDMEEEELLALCDERVHDTDWKWLIDHWRSAEAVARSLRGKADRAKLTQIHTTGSKSHARLAYEMSLELGRPARRDEVFIEGHTHKNGIPHKESETTINALKTAVIDHPELKEKSIQEGDVFFHVCGPEKNGYVCCVGLGPTSADLEMHGAKKYTATRLQMEIEARRQADQKVEVLESRLDQMQQQLNKLLQLQLASQNVNITPHGSNNELHVNSTHANEDLDDQEDDARSCAGDEMEDEHLSDYENTFVRRRAVCQEEQHEGGGRDVILYSVVRPYGAPVAKATIQTTSPNAIVGGTRLGVQYCEVVVNHVFMREAILPRPYGAVTTIGQACGRCIAWPHDRMKDDKKSSRQSKFASLGTRPL